MREQFFRQNQNTSHAAPKPLKREADLQSTREVLQKSKPRKEDLIDQASTFQKFEIEETNHTQ
jgi:hypothetical protein